MPLSGSSESLARPARRRAAAAVCSRPAGASRPPTFRLRLPRGPRALHPGGSPTPSRPAVTVTRTTVTLSGSAHWHVLAARGSGRVPVGGSPDAGIFSARLLPHHRRGRHTSRRSRSESGICAQPGLGGTSQAARPGRTPRLSSTPHSDTLAGTNNIPEDRRVINPPPPGPLPAPLMSFRVPDFVRVPDVLSQSLSFLSGCD